METGNVLIGQSGGPTSVINSSLSGVIEHAGTLHGVKAIYGMQFAIEGLLNRDLIDVSSLSAEELRGLRETPGSALGSSRITSIAPLWRVWSASSPSWTRR